MQLTNLTNAQQQQTAPLSPFSAMQQQQLLAQLHDGQLL
jgi:hypothetical protein